jgi:multicomponent Na+:H+ antiporter subunit D
VLSFDDNMSLLPAICVAAPIIMACLLLALGRSLPRPVVDALAVGTVGGVASMLGVLLAAAADSRIINWVGRWEPKQGYSVGIVLVGDEISCCIALIAAALVTLALIYSWRYFDSVEAHYHCLMLLFLAGMVGFALSGDLFDMFVFFELMGAAAYALTGFKVEDPTAVQGALNFGIINSLGAYIGLMGIGLLFSRVGNLTLPQLHVALAHHRPDALVVAAFVAVLTAFLVKGAMVPFHFWLADAHAVAPTPVCVLFSGVMVPLGVYAAFRVYWLVFADTLPMDAVRRTFIVLGAVTAVTGAVMCFGQRHFKRLLAYSTIAHVGLFLVAAGCLTEAGTSGAALYIAGHAGVKSALFLLAGLMLNRYGSVDEIDLFGRGRGALLMPSLLIVAGLALAGLPPFGTALGKSAGEEAAAHAGYGWAPVLFIAVSALTGGAVLRVAARVYFGLGDRPPRTRDSDETSGSEERPEVPSLLSRVRITMLVPILVLLAGALALGVIPGTHHAAEGAAGEFTDSAAYATEALTGHAVAASPVPAVGNWTVSGVLLGLLSAGLAVGCATVALYRRRVRAWRLMDVAVERGFDGLRRLHSGHVGDYVAWLMTGVVTLGAFIGLPLR